jgi:hypothetical protein
MKIIFYNINPAQLSQLLVTNGRKAQTDPEDIK